MAAETKRPDDMAMKRDRLEVLLAEARLALPNVSDIEIRGADPILASHYAVGEVAACALALGGSAAGTLHELRGGSPQKIRVEAGAAAASLLGFFFLKSDAGLDLTRHQTPFTQLYPARDGRFIHLHGGFPHLAAGVARVLDVSTSSTAETIAKAVNRFDAIALEEEIAAEGFCAAAVRSEEEWIEHPQGAALSHLPAVEIIRIDDADPRPLPPLARRPLQDLRVLDLTRVLAGPTCGRTLAEHGASVLRIGAPTMPSVEAFVVETGRGKRNAFLDLERADDALTLHQLSAAADIFCQGYRGGSLEARGFGAEEMAERHPGLVYVSINCYGHVGPWSQRPGWEQLAQSATGIAHREGSGEDPHLIGAAATDYTTGYLAAYGAMEALRRRALEGGSWHVRVSLVQTAMWLIRVGADLDPDAAGGLGDIESRMRESTTHWGQLRHLGPVLEMSKTPPTSLLPPTPLGSHTASWATTGPTA